MYIYRLSQAYIKRPGVLNIRLTYGQCLFD